jgi:hypothetical protein
MGEARGREMKIPRPVGPQRLHRPESITEPGKWRVTVPVGNHPTLARPPAHEPRRKPARIPAIGPRPHIPVASEGRSGAR